MKPRVIIFINGIMNKPGSARGWTDRAVTWTHKHTEFSAEKFEYFCDVVFRRLFQGRRAKDLAALIEEYKGDEIVLVGHSNGCDLILRALKLISPFTQIKAIHFISGASEPDFYKNGLNQALRENRIEQITVYVAGKDLPMKIAAWSGKVLGVFGLGYGTLGRRGAVNNLHPTKVREIIKPTFGHSDWFDGEAFHELMTEITREPSGAFRGPLEAEYKPNHAPNL